MTDVRSLLKTERATRRIDHPYASYSATGTLECSLCKLPLKSDLEVWNNHLRSTQHISRAERLRISTKKAPSKPLQPPFTTNTTTITAISESSNGNKKRKANYDEEDPRKRTRPQDLDLYDSIKRKVSFDEPVGTNISTISLARHIEKARPSPSQITSTPKSPPSTSEIVDEAEWAAFEASIARTASPSPPPTIGLGTAFTAVPTITAAPLSAAELATQSRVQASRQSKEKREAEVEAEKEDAARQLEEEFDEMEGLEKRVTRLREQREALRLRRAAEAEIISVEASIEGSCEIAATIVGSDDSENDGDDDDGDFDEWGAWGST